MSDKKYDNSSISSLKGAERVRQKPGVIFGSDNLEGAQHTYFEILSNSIDEAKDGFGKVIETTLYEDGSLSVRDHGRGIPLEWNEAEARYNWELVYCELYAGGKYDASDNNYEFSLGLNGLGACATQYASEYFDVEVIRDGYQYNLHFEKGENIGGLTKKKTKSKDTGTFQKWKPDKLVFTDVNITYDHLLDVNKKQAMVNKGIKFVVKEEKSNQVQELYYENGIVDYLEEISEEKNISSSFVIEGEGMGRDTEDRDLYKVKAEIAFAFNNDCPKKEYYHNSSYLEHGGAPDKAVKNAFVFVLDKLLKQKNKYNKNESKITFNDIEDSLIVIVNSFSTQTSYENQTKKAINNKFIQEFLTELIKEKLEIWFLENPGDCNRVIDQILANKRSREASEKQRVALKKKLVNKGDSWDRVKKFVDCKSKDVSKRELFIVEGDSALGSVKLARDAEFQAVMPVRGKILNCLKVDISRIISSDIIMDLIRVLGCGIEVPIKSSKKNVLSFNLDNLKWNKIICCTDADVDGFQIRTLIITMIYRLCPTLIQEGYVYIAETPLYEMRYKGRGEEKTFFAFDDREKNQIMKGKDPSKFFIQRSKGLGENSVDMMWDTTMNPENRRLIKIVPEDAEIMSKYFDLYLGNNVAARKAYIEENGHLYVDDLDIS